MTGCGACSGVPSGYTRVWQVVQAGQVTREFDSQGAALRAQRASGGGGRIQSVTRKNR